MVLRVRDPMDPLPMEHREQPFPVVEPLRKHSGTINGNLELGRTIALSRDQGRDEGRSEGELPVVAVCAAWQLIEKGETLAQVDDGLAICRPRRGLRSGAQPVLDRLLDQSAAGGVPSHDLRWRWRVRRLEGCDDPSMDLLPPRAEKARVGCITDQGMLEDIAGPRGPAARKNQFG
jgi:hypothetical protein